MLVFGGSQGARSINHAAVEAFAGARFRVLHAAGERDLPRAASAPGPHYDLRGYIAEFGEALLASDLVVARAGGSIFEIAAHGRPAVLIPYPYATADHQAANAALHGARRSGGRDPRRELTGAAAGARGRRAAGRSRLAGPGARWPTRRAAASSGASATAAGRDRRDELLAGGANASRRCLATVSRRRATASLRRHRRGGDERAGADRRRRSGAR